MILQCEECKHEFIYHRKKRFCSSECQDINWRYKKFGVRKCAQCGKDYIPNRETSRFCSEACTLEYGRLIQDRPPVEEIPCPVCDKKFKPLVHHKGKRLEYCSQGCWGKAQKIKRLQGSACRVYFRACKWCGRLFTSRSNSVTYCSLDECQKKKYWLVVYINSDKHQNKVKEGNCKECGLQFINKYGEKRRLFCSDECRDNAAKRTEGYKTQRKQGNRRRRARLRDVESTPYRDKDIFERDNWICQLCGQPVDKGLKFPHRMSASLDHKIPLAKKGPDTSDNVQLAHFICNSHKRDEVYA